MNPSSRYLATDRPTDPTSSHSDEEDAVTATTAHGVYAIHPHARRFPVEDEDDELLEDELLDDEGEDDSEETVVADELDVAGLELDDEEFSELGEDWLDRLLLDDDELRDDRVEELLGDDGLEEDELLDDSDDGLDDDGLEDDSLDAVLAELHVDRDADELLLDSDDSDEELVVDRPTVLDDDLVALEDDDAEDGVLDVGDDEEGLDGLLDDTDDAVEGELGEEELGDETLDTLDAEDDSLDGDDGDEDDDDGNRTVLELEDDDDELLMLSSMSANSLTESPAPRTSGSVPSKPPPQPSARTWRVVDAVALASVQSTPPTVATMEYCLGVVPRLKSIPAEWTITGASRDSTSSIGKPVPASRSCPSTRSSEILMEDDGTAVAWLTMADVTGWPVVILTSPSAESREAYSPTMG